MSFDDLFKNPKMETHQSHQPSPNAGYSNQHSSNIYTAYQLNNPQPQNNIHINHHMNYLNPQNHHIQRGYSNTHHQTQGFNQNQQYPFNNNLAHNPYVGYAPYHHHGTTTQQIPHHNYSPQPQNGQYSNITLKWFVYTMFWIILNKFIKLSLSLTQIVNHVMKETKRYTFYLFFIQIT